MFGSRTHNQSSYEVVAEKTYTWRSSEQNFFTYDRETKERVALPEGAKLIPLTATHSVTGVHERDHGKATQRYNRIYSNEFTDYRQDVITVKEVDNLDNTKTVIAEGVYSPTVKDIITDLPYAKFTTNIYCLLDGEVVRISLAGASLKPWIDFETKLRQTNTYLTDSHCVLLDGAEEVRNGAVTFYSPKFKLGDITAEENEVANATAFEVEGKIARNKANGSNDSTDFTDNIPATQKAETQSEAEPAATTDDSGNIDLSSIPF